MGPTARVRSTLLLAALGAGCAIPALTPLTPGLRSPFTGYSSPLYRDDRLWLCRPDLANSPCRGDLTATELRRDGSRAIVPHVAAAHPDVDCFFVYGTVDLGIFPGNYTDFGDVGAIAQVALAQAARFDEVCAVYAPLYRQITIGTYFWGGKQKERRLEVAFSDVQDAFLHYMGQYNHGRKVVLIGHSQGAGMVVTLLQRWFDADPTLRERLLVAMPVGGPVEVASGSTTGGSFANIPACTSPDELGCVVAYHSYRATGRSLSDWIWDDPRGAESACVNPAAEGASGWQRFSRSYFATTGGNGRGLNGLDDVKTPFVLLRDLYWGACVNDAGRAYLLVTAAPSPGDVRQSPVDLGSWRLNTAFGLHALDFQFPLGDLIDLVRRKAARAR